MTELKIDELEEDLEHQIYGTSRYYELRDELEELLEELYEELEQ